MNIEVTMEQLESRTMQLAENLDLAAAAPLKAELLGLRGAPLALDASRVQRIGGLCLQVLLAAQATWVADDQPFSVADASPDFQTCLERMGAGDLIEGIS